MEGDTQIKGERYLKLSLCILIIRMMNSRIHGNGSLIKVSIKSTWDINWVNKIFIKIIAGLRGGGNREFLDSLSGVRRAAGRRAVAWIALRSE